MGMAELSVKFQVRKVFVISISRSATLCHSTDGTVAQW